MSAKRQSRLLLAALTVVALTLTVAACAGPARAEGQGRSQTDPFSSRMEGGEGIVVEWSGYAHGHQPGEEVTFELVLRNEGQDVWRGRSCIRLLDRHSVAITLIQEVFSLQPGESWTRQVPIRFPDDLAEGTYGLALIIPGCLSSVTTIQVGNEGDTYVGPWPEPVCP